MHHGNGTQNSFYDDPDLFYGSCHQSQFYITHEAKVIFGPAKRPLPQLPITVDDEGYLVARSDFTEPVGPSFWERNT